MEKNKLKSLELLLARRKKTLDKAQRLFDETKLEILGRKKSTGNVEMWGLKPRKNMEDMCRELLLYEASTISGVSKKYGISYNSSLEKIKRFCIAHNEALYYECLGKKWCDGLNCYLHRSTPNMDDVKKLRSSGFLSA